MRWNPFKRGDKGQPEPKAPSSGLGPGVSAGPAGAEGGQPPKRGLLGRIFGRKPKPTPEEEPQAPAAPAGRREEEAGPEGGGGPAAPQRTYPSSLFVSATGAWKISDSIWYGTASGTLTGAAVKVYLDALEAGELDVCIYLIAEAYDDGSGFAKNLDLDGCDVQID